MRHFPFNHYDSADEQQCQALLLMQDHIEIFDALAATALTIKTQESLRKKYPAEVVRQAISLAELRRRAQRKFSRASRMWFDRVGLEQATAEVIAVHKARRFPQGNVADLCCGIGSDAVALARAGCHVEAVDIRAANCLRTQWNAEVYDAEVQVRRDDVTDYLPRASFVHVDPDRRQNRSQRAKRIEGYSPGPAELDQICNRFRGGAVKVGPASDFARHFPNAEIELISYQGECREATIWFGELAGSFSRRATVLPTGCSLSADPYQAAAELSEPHRYIYDPDPAIVRSGLLDACAEQLGLTRLDDKEEYLTSDQLIDSVFCQGFELLENLPNNHREIRKVFRTMNFGSVEVKSRHLTIRSEQLRNRLSFSGTDPGVLLFARLGGKARCLVCRRVRGENDWGHIASD